ncbi:SsrA-binding protein SmpB [Candidatus Cytomitobacter indipagum]|uniref:SsrA-binding protein n=1 Tax=Candidatus Cytomitobacter indipagum TaxID=2601575 RepID=A0A5C0UDJ1_9PROT|nr:SsrA-binding protein SmpB [Candidatus Cytomitobacter indipagum]QEK37827.1 SsrA-binding protein SmpB [Candidatus Cytomitobacter indipagum]
MLLNRKARFDYTILSSMEAGIVLLGGEVKVLRNGMGDIMHSHVMLHDNEAWLMNMQIPVYKQSSINYDVRRNRKLLLKKKQVRSLIGKMKLKGVSVVPLKLYFVRGLVKVEIGTAEGKKKADKRQTIKERDLQREMQRTKI